MRDLVLWLLSLDGRPYVTLLYFPVYLAGRPALYYGAFLEYKRFQIKIKIFGHGAAASTGSISSCITVKLYVQTCSVRLKSWRPMRLLVINPSGSFVARSSLISVAPSGIFKGFEVVVASLRARQNPET